MSSKGWLALLDVWEWPGDPPVCLGVIGRPSQLSWGGWESILDVQELSGGPPGSPGAVGRPSRISGSC